MPRREGLGFVLERVSPTRCPHRTPSAKLLRLERKEKLRHAPPGLWFAPSSTSGDAAPGGGLILGVVVKTVTSRHA